MSQAPVSPPAARRGAHAHGKGRQVHVAQALHRRQRAVRSGQCGDLVSSHQQVGVHALLGGVELRARIHLVGRERLGSQRLCARPDQCGRHHQHTGRRQQHPQRFMTRARGPYHLGVHRAPLASAAAALMA